MAEKKRKRKGAELQKGGRVSGASLRQRSQDPRKSRAPSVEGNREESGAGSLLREEEPHGPRPRGGSSLLQDEAQATGAGAA